MDKVLFVSIVGLFSAFITAVLGFTKLINDKESKISEFRQEWTSSVRKTLAELVSCFRVFFEINKRSLQKAILCQRLSNELSKIDHDTSEFKIKNEALLHNKAMLEKFQEELIGTKINIQKNIALTLLHFKPNDPDFQHVESKIEAIMNIISSLGLKLEEDSGVEKKEEELILKTNEAEIICRDMLSLSRHVMKNEWERIKGGEDNYKKTKKIFLNGSLVISLTMAVIFLLLTISKYSHYLAEEMIDKNIVQMQSITKAPLSNDKLEIEPAGSSSYK